MAPKQNTVKWKYDVISTDSIYPNLINPRTINQKQRNELKKSIKKFGQCYPISINKEGKIIDGHQRYDVIKSLGIESIKVAIPDEEINEEEEKELAIRLNKNVGSFDVDLLGNYWEAQDLIQWGFTMEELGVESVPFQEEAPKRFNINISCVDNDQLEMIEKYIQSLVDDFPGSKYKVRVK